MSKAIPPGSAVYIRYRDHVLFRNTSKALDQPAERETLGWLTQENSEAICIQWDRSIKPLPNEKQSATSGLVILKNCVLEIHALPLQNISRWPLIRRSNKTRIAEYALRKAERKTQPKWKRTGANQWKP